MHMHLMRFIPFEATCGFEYLIPYAKITNAVLPLLPTPQKITAWSVFVVVHFLLLHTFRLIRVTFALLRHIVTSSRVRSDLAFFFVFRTIDCWSTLNLNERRFGIWLGLDS